MYIQLGKCTVICFYNMFTYLAKADFLNKRITFGILVLKNISLLISFKLSCFFGRD